MMDNPFESLLKAAQQIDSPNVNVKVVVEMKQQTAPAPAPTMQLSTPPRPSVSSSATAATATMPPPPHHQVQLVPVVNNNGFLSIPSLNSPYRARAPVQSSPLPCSFYDAPVTAAESLGQIAPPTAAMAAMTMASSTSPSSYWPYYGLSPRFSGHDTSNTVGHSNPHPTSATHPLCLFSGAPDNASASPQAQAHVPQVSQGLAELSLADAAPTASAFSRPVAEHIHTNFVSPTPFSTPKKSRTGILESKPSAEDDAPPTATGLLFGEEEAATATPAKATTKMRNAVTPDTIVNHDDDDDYDDGEEYDTISTSATAWPVDGNITLPTLFDEDDKGCVKTSHYIIFTEVLEAFVVPKYHGDTPAAATATKSKGKAAKKASAPKKHKRSTKKIDFRAGSVAFRCRFCKDSPYKDEMPLATIYPQSLKGLYRANLRFQANHLKKCKYCPVKLKKRIMKAQRDDHHSQRGTRSYWMKSAARKGFRKVMVDGKSMLGFVDQAQDYY